ncbi:MAG: endonuclease/exonuclease/phosphatase family protein [Herminiimonas sp.]|nr:endonuclease/exonuclease/phosphatase family protein [Herminiimonas sp.]
MPQEIRFATFNVCNLALPGEHFYPDQEPYTQQQYDAKVAWIVQQIDALDADVIGFQEIFSQAALREVLARSVRYRDAHHVGFEPEVRNGNLTPNVALVSRLPVRAGAVMHAELPRQLSVTLPGMDEPVTRFTRPILQAQVVVSPTLVVNVVVCHLKSKRPDYRSDGSEDELRHFDLAVLRSMIRCGVEALGLRYLLTDQVQGNRVPLVVMGDFNDVASAMSTQLVLGAGRYGKIGFDGRLFETYRIQSRRDPLRDVGFTHMYDGAYSTIDHILVSEEFNPASRYAIGEVLEVVYVNDHIAFRWAHASDHGLVMARIRLFGTPEPGPTRGNTA